MSLLDALTYIIDADNSKLDKAVDKSTKKTDDFGKAMLSAEGRAGLMEDKIKGAFTRIGGAIIAAVAASKALQAVNERVQMVEQITRTADAAGVAVGEVDALGKSIELLGGDAQGARSSLEGLARGAAAAMNNVQSSQAKAFAALGVSLRDAQGQVKGTMEVLSDLAGAVEGMNRQQAEMHLSKIGVTDPKSIELIFKGRQELDRMLRVQREQGVVTKESAERVRVYSETLAKLRQSAGAATSGIVDWILPAITHFLAKLNLVVSWMNRHDTLVKGFFIGLATVLTAMFLPAVVSATAAVWALIAPFLAVAAPIAAVVALFALLYDDVMNFLDGNDSLIGQISEKYPAVGEAVKALAEVVKVAFGWMQDAVNFVVRDFSMAVANTKAQLRDLANFFGLTFQFISNVVKNAWSYVSGVFDSISSVISKIGKWLGFGGGEDIQVTASTVSAGISDMEAQAGENMKAAQAQLNQAAANPMNSVTSNAISNASNAHTETNVQVGQITVQTQATDAQGISRAIGGELDGQLKNLQSDSASGVAR